MAQSEDSLLTTFQFLPQKDLMNVIKSNQKLTKPALLSASFPVYNDVEEKIYEATSVCENFSEADISILMKNKNINKQLPA